MAEIRTTYEVDEGLALLERAVSYTLGSLQLVTPEAMARSTPCRDWDLATLLAHMDDSLLAMQEAVEFGDVSMTPAPPDPAALVDPVAAVRNRARQMLGAWSSEDRLLPTRVAGWAVPTSLVLGTGAVEVAVHGWDVAAACGQPRPLPEELAKELLPCAHVLVTAADRPGRFAAPIGPSTTAADRLLGFLGRHRRWPLVPPEDMWS